MPITAHTTPSLLSWYKDDWDFYRWKHTTFTTLECFVKFIIIYSRFAAWACYLGNLILQALFYNALVLSFESWILGFRNNSFLLLRPDLCSIRPFCLQTIRRQNSYLLLMCGYSKAGQLLLTDIFLKERPRSQEMSAGYIKIKDIA